MTRFQSRPDGRFRVTLPRGRYLLDPLEQHGALFKGVLSVRVTRSKFTRLTIRYDNGGR